MTERPLRSDHDDRAVLVAQVESAVCGPNKVLALIGRVEVRDWVDVLSCDQRLQPLGYLAWAACGKDPGFSPASLLDQARRTARYSAAEVATLAFEGDTPDAAVLSRQWQEALANATEIVRALPPSMSALPC